MGEPMEIQDFIKEINEMGYRTHEHRTYITVWWHNEDEEEDVDIAEISKTERFVLNTNYDGFENLTEDEKEKMLGICYKLAATPIGERDTEKRYYLRHRWMNQESGGRCYLKFNAARNEYTLDSRDGGYLFSIDGVCNSKAEFTEAEIEEIKKKFNTSFEDFEIMEVKE